MTEQGQDLPLAPETPPRPTWQQQVMVWFIPTVAGLFGLLALVSFVLAWVMQPGLRPIEEPVVASSQINPVIDPALANEISSVLAELAAAEPVVSASPTELPLEEVDFGAKLTPINSRWQRNAAPAPILKPGAAKIALVIDDLGERAEISAAAMELPPEVTLAYLPFGEFSRSQAAMAKTLGHEILVHLPMQPMQRPDGTQINPGPNGLFTSMSADELETVTDINLTGFLELAVGVNNHMGSAMTSDATAMRPVLETIAAKELLFLDSLTTPRSQVRTAAKGLPMPLLRRDVFLDHYIDSDKITEMLEKTAEVALKQGHAIAIGHPYEVTYDAIKAWLPTLAERNIQLVPLTALLADEQ